MAVFLQGYQFEVVYKKGKLHTYADSLSRCDYQNKTEKECETESDDVVIDPRVCAIQQEAVVIKYILEYVESKSLKINSVTTEDKSDKLSAMICAIDAYESLDPTKHKLKISELTKEKLIEAQKSDQAYAPIFEYKENGKVPDDKDEVNRLVAEAQFYEIDAGVLYHLYHPRTKAHQWENVKRQLEIPFPF